MPNVSELWSLRWINKACCMRRAQRKTFPSTESISGKQMKTLYGHLKTFRRLQETVFLRGRLFLFWRFISNFWLFIESDHLNRQKTLKYNSPKIGKNSYFGILTGQPLIKHLVLSTGVLTVKNTWARIHFVTLYCRAGNPRISLI